MNLSILLWWLTGANFPTLQTNLPVLALPGDRQLKYFHGKGNWRVESARSIFSSKYPRMSVIELLLIFFLFSSYTKAWEWDGSKEKIKSRLDDVSPHSPDFLIDKFVREGKTLKRWGHDINTVPTSTRLQWDTKEGDVSFLKCSLFCNFQKVVSS